MTNFAPPFANIDPADKISAAKALAFELAAAANTGQGMLPEVVASAAATAAELAIRANTELIYLEPVQEIK